MGAALRIRQMSGIPERKLHQDEGANLRLRLCVARVCAGRFSLCLRCVWLLGSACASSAVSSSFLEAWRIMGCNADLLESTLPSWGRRRLLGLRGLRGFDRLA